MSVLSLTNDEPKVQMVLEGHRKTVTSISFNPNNQQFASSSEDHSIMIWTKWSDAPKTGPSYCFSGHKDAVTCVDYSPNCQVLASSSKDHTIRIWVPTILGDSKEVRAHTSAVNTVKFSPDGLKLITGSNDKSIKLWDVETRQFIASYLGHNNWVRCAKFSPLGNLIISCSDDRTIRIWDSISGQLIHTFLGNKGSPNYISMHSNNNSIAAATDSGSVRIYDARNKKLQQHYSLHNNATCLDWHPQANYFLTCGLDCMLRIIDVMEGRPLFSLGDKSGITTCKFNVDGKFFAAGGLDGTVTVWKTNFIA